MVKQTRKRKLNASRESEIDEGYVDGTFYRVVHSLCCLISSLSSRRFWRHLLPSFAYFLALLPCFSQKSRRLSSREKRSATSTGRRRDLCVVVVRSISSKRCINGDDVIRRRRRRRRDDGVEENFFLFCLSPISDIFRRGEEEEVSFPHKKIMIKMLWVKLTLPPGRLM